MQSSLKSNERARTWFLSFLYKSTELIQATPPRFNNNNNK